MALTLYNAQQLVFCMRIPASIMLGGLICISACLNVAQTVVTSNDKTGVNDRDQSNFRKVRRFKHHVK
jgi:hypothetical protein